MILRMMTTLFARQGCIEARGNGNQALLVTLGHAEDLFILRVKTMNCFFAKPAVELDYELVVDCTAAGDSFRSAAVAMAEGNTVARAMGDCLREWCIGCSKDGRGTVVTR